MGLDNRLWHAADQSPKRTPLLFLMIESAINGTRFSRSARMKKRTPSATRHSRNTRQYTNPQFIGIACVKLASGPRLQKKAFESKRKLWQRQCVDGSFNCRWVAHRQSWDDNMLIRRCFAQHRSQEDSFSRRSFPPATKVVGQRSPLPVDTSLATKSTQLLAMHKIKTQTFNPNGVQIAQCGRS